MTVDFENLEPPRMEGLDAQLAAVSILDPVLFSYKLLLSNFNCFNFILQKKKYTSKNEPEQNGKILHFYCIFIYARELALLLFSTPFLISLVLSGPLDLTSFAMV